MKYNELPKIHNLKFDEITFSHGGDDPVLKNCSFEFPEDSIVWLKSTEGGGKSTVLQILAGLTLPNGGLYYINDTNVLDMSFEEFLPYRLKIGYTFDYGGLISNKSVADNLLLPLVYHRLIPEAEAKIRVKDWLEMFDIVKFSKERPAHVPGRIRKLVVLLRGLITYPDLLLLDDPSVGIGSEASQTLVHLMNDLRERGFLKQIMITSYDDAFMNLMSHKIIHLDQGLLYPGSVYTRVEDEKKVVGL